MVKVILLKENSIYNKVIYPFVVFFNKKDMIAKKFRLKEREVKKVL